MRKVVVWVALSIAVVAACGDGSGEKVRVARLSESCTLNSDCAEPLVCAFQRCHDVCETSRDCDPGQRCVVSDRPFHVCQLEDERECLYTSDCPEGQTCIDGLCGPDGE